MSYMTHVVTLLYALYQCQRTMELVRPKDVLDLLREEGEPTGDFYKRLSYVRFKGYITPVKTRGKVKYISLSRTGLKYLRRRGLI